MMAQILVVSSRSMFQLLPPVSTSSSPTLTYQQTITLPGGSQKQVTLNVPISTGTQGSTQAITANLLDANNQKISSETTTLRSIGPSDIFVGILSDQTTGFGPLSTFLWPTRPHPSLLSR